MRLRRLRLPLLRGLLPLLCGLRLLLPLLLRLNGLLRLPFVRLGLLRRGGGVASVGPLSAKAAENVLIVELFSAPGAKLCHVINPP